MTNRAYNFNPGPAALPLPVLEQAQRELLDFNGSGISILEASHRSDMYQAVHQRTIDNLRALLVNADDFDILFMTGGAQTQFALLPMNLLPSDAFAQYLITGSWSQYALREAKKLGAAQALWSSEERAFRCVPREGDYCVDAAAAYLHYTTNNTIMGTQFHHIPKTGSVPLIADMSSDILSAQLELTPYHLIYAGAQKNLGVAGVTLVMIRRDLLARCRVELPAMLSYAQVAAKNSLLNTPPVFAIYMMGLVTQYLIEQGGMAAIAQANQQKAARLYHAIDESGGFYTGYADKDSRSTMNVTFRLPSHELENHFLQQAAQAAMVGLKGHRLLGGIRVSLYNAVSLAAVEALTDLMNIFVQKWG
jgi:phosphoserine aminotransferase